MWHYCGTGPSVGLLLLTREDDVSPTGVSGPETDHSLVPIRSVQQEIQAHTTTIFSSSLILARGSLIGEASAQ